MNNILFLQDCFSAQRLRTSGARILTVSRGIMSAMVKFIAMAGQKWNSVVSNVYNDQKGISNPIPFLKGINTFMTSYFKLYPLRSSFKN